METKNLNVVECAHCIGMNTVIFKLAEGTMGSELGRSEEDWKR
jgi:hypothetical protein